ncbi:MAG: tetratricopeptide repeat protein [Gemmatimonadota bacterium]
MREERSLPSLLPGVLRALLVGLVVIAALVFADSLYLVAVRLLELGGGDGAGVASSLFFQAALLGHSVIGTLFVALVALFVGLHLPKVWRRRDRRSVGSGLATLALALGLLATGLFILTEAATRQHRWVWWLHLAAAVGLPVLYVVHRKSSVVRFRRGVARQFANVVVGLTLALGTGHLLVGQVKPPDVTADELPPTAVELAAERYGVVPPGFVSPLSVFYPSPVSTSTGRYAPAAAVLGPGAPPPEEVAEAVLREGFYTESGIGSESCVRCHPDVTAQWEASAHRFSSFNNPFYEASIDLLRSNDARRSWWLNAHRERTVTEMDTDDGVVKSRWCGACHDPALLFTGAMDEAIDRTSVEAQAGLTCLTCHGIRGLHDRTGNGNYILRSTSPDLYLFADATEPGIPRRLHDAALRARPEAHRSAMLVGVLRSSEFCATCHKVSLRDPLNEYRWLRGQNEFDTWENSGVSREGAQTFYLPPSRRICQDCHMPPEPAPRGDLAAVDGTVRSHRFLAVNTALPFIRGDTATLRRIEEFLQDEKVRVDVFGWRSADGARTERALEGATALEPGAEIVLDVVVRNQGTGHSFPGGTLDSNEGWLDVRLLDEEGRLVARNGGLGPDGHLDPMAHVYRARFVDSAGEPIDRRNPQDIRATVFVNAIGPGAASLAHYRLPVPETPGNYTLDVRLRWRKFNRGYSEFVYESVPEAFPEAGEAPELPITTVARTALELRVGDGATGDEAGDSAGRADGVEEDWIRWNDFGIASIREGTTRAAREAFARVSEIEPERADGPMNLARVALNDGDVQAALDHLAEAERREPENARIDWLLARARLADGDYAAAVAAYRRTLASFPRHRASLMGLGRALYLDGRYEAALEPLDRLLAIDPETRAAWYHRMLVLRALGRTDEAAEAKAMVEYFRVDESAGRLTRRVRTENPGVNAMSQDVRTHPLRRASP